MFTGRQISILLIASLALSIQIVFAAKESDDSLHPGPHVIGLGLHRGNKSQSQLDEAVKRNPKSPMVYLERGDGYLGTADNDKALADFNKAIQLDPHCGKAYIGRYLVYCDSQNFAQAFAELKNAEKASAPDLAMDALFLSAELHFKTKKFPEALVELTKVIEAKLFSNRRLAQVYCRRGVIYDRLHNIPAAIADYSSAIKLDSNLGSAYLFRANDYRGQGKRAEALADYNYVASRTENVPENKRIFELESAREDLYRFRSDYFNSINRRDLAEADLKKLKMLSNEDMEAAPFQLH